MSIDRQFCLDQAAAHRKSTTAQNKAHALAWEGLADRLYPAVVPPPPVVVPPPVAVPPTGKVPALAMVGPRTTLTTSSAKSLLPGNYVGTRFGVVSLQPGTFTFVDCEVSFDVQYPSRTVTLDHCKVNGGVWFEGGGHAGWTIKASICDGGAGQALRPSGPGAITVTDSWLLTHGTSTDPALGIHTEALQLLAGADIIATRCGLSVEPRWNGTYTPITAVLNASAAGSNSTYVDCEFGYFDGTSWSAGGGFFAIYPGQAAFTRPRIHHPAPWYNNVVPVKLTDPTYL